MVVMLELINGLQFGVEHISGEEDDEYHYAIVINFAILRFVFMKMLNVV
jgi:hypothetical protein